MIKSGQRFGVLGVILILSFTFASDCFADIKYPWRAVKAIVKNGDSLGILFDNVKSTPIDSVILVGPYNRVVLNIDSISIGRFVYDTYSKASTNNKIWVRIPGDTPEELYNLIVKSGGETSVSLKSVKTVREFRMSHSFIHITDTHISRQWVGEPENGYGKELELFDNFVKVANIIAPDFVITTGDNIHDYTRFNADSTGWGGELERGADQLPLAEEKFANYFDGANGLSGIHGLISPTFSIPGNHDFYGVPGDDHQAKVAQWNRLCGKRVYGFSYAGTRVLAADDFLGDPVIDIPNESPMSGLQGDILKSFLSEEGPGSVRIMAQHRHDRCDTLFINAHKINILLNGHSHTPGSEYVGETPTLISRPGVVCRSGVTNIDEELGFFRIFRINGSSYESSPPLRFCKDPEVNYLELDLNLTLDFERPNDGSSSSNSATINNQLGVKLPGCKIRFVMKKGIYEVKGGQIDQVIESGDLTVVDVRVDVENGKPATITIS